MMVGFAQRRFAGVVLGAVGLLWGVGSVAAQVVILVSPSSFTSPTTLIDFEYFPDLSQVPYVSPILADQWKSVGILLSDDSLADGISAYSSTNGVNPHSGTRGVADSSNAPGGYVDIRFVIPGTTTPTTVQEVGLWSINGDTSSTITFYASDGSLLQTITPGTGTVFAGLQAPQGIARVRVSDADYYLLDDLQFSTIPEPKVAFLAGLGTAMVMLAGRLDQPRRKRRRETSPSTSAPAASSTPVDGSGTGVKFR
jgi:hypothetical protein